MNNPETITSSAEFKEHTCNCSPDSCGCSQNAYQYADISIPIDFSPDSKVGPIESECCGEPSVQCETDSCGSTISVVITQNVKIKIPITVGVKTVINESFIQCSEASII